MSSIKLDDLSIEIIIILDRLKGGKLGLLTGTGQTVGAILSWLERENPTPTEVMEILQRLRSAGRLGKFLNLVSHRDMRRFLREKQVPWNFVLQHWEPDINDTGTFFAGFVIGAGQNVVEGIRFVAVIIGSPFSEELARERSQFWEGISLFLSSPFLLIQQGVEQIFAEVEEKLWNLSFLEAGRVLGNVTVTLLTMVEAFHKLPDLMRKLSTLLPKLTHLTVRQIEALGISLERLRELALNPRPIAVTPDGIFMIVEDEIVVAKDASRPAGHIPRSEVIRETGGTTSKSAPKLIGLERVSNRAKEWLTKEGLWERAKKSLPNASDDIISSIHNFLDVPGFDQVIKNYLSGSSRMQEGMRFVMRYAETNFADKVGKVPIHFERPVMGRIRICDIVVDGVTYELKSVKEVTSKIIIGGETFGQLERDLLRFVAYRRIVDRYLLDLSRIKNKELKWVFDSRKLAKADIVKAMKEHLRKTKLFKKYKNIDELINAIDDIVEVWPSEK